MQAYTALLQQSGGRFLERDQLAAFIEEIKVWCGLPLLPLLPLLLLGAAATVLAGAATQGCCTAAASAASALSAPLVLPLPVLPRWPTATHPTEPAALPVPFPALPGCCPALQPFNLTKSEVVQLINHRPPSVVEVSLVRAGLGLLWLVACFGWWVGGWVGPRQPALIN